MDSKDALRVGVAEVDITPPVGTPMAGSLRPRPSKGIQDPLYVKAIVLESKGKKLAYIAFDLIGLYRKQADHAVAMASERTGIPSDHIVWAASHTHTGPCIGKNAGKWLQDLPNKVADCVAKADASKAPARMSRLRGFNGSLGQNRRLLFKDGTAINRWNLARSNEHLQCIGLEGPIDPEIGILAFDDNNGQLMAVLFQFALHANANFSDHFSGDYPAVVAARLRERFGPQVSTLFFPGPCGNINPLAKYRQVGESLADVIIQALNKREPSNRTPILASMKLEYLIRFRDFKAREEKRIKSSGWGPAQQEVFFQRIKDMQKKGITQTKTILQAWRIGDIGFASLPGELFVEWGIKIKQESPFTWTYPVEIGGDYLGYLVTQRAWEAGGYEPLSKVPHKAVSGMVDKVLDMLKKLYS